MHSRINVIKFYFGQVLHRDTFFVDIPRPQKPALLSKVLAQEDIVKLFEVTTNQKEKRIAMFHFPNLYWANYDLIIKFTGPKNICLKGSMEDNIPYAAPRKYLRRK